MGTVHFYPCSLSRSGVFLLWTSVVLLIVLSAALVRSPSSPGPSPWFFSLLKNWISAVIFLSCSKFSQWAKAYAPVDFSSFLLKTRYLVLGFFCRRWFSSVDTSTPRLPASRVCVCVCRLACSAWFSSWPSALPVQPGLQLSALILLLVPSREANSRPAFFSSVAVHALWQFVLPVRDSRRGALFGISSARQIHRRSSRLLHQSASSWSRFLFAAQDRFRFSSLICSSSPSLPSLHLHSVLSVFCRFSSWSSPVRTGSAAGVFGSSVPLRPVSVLPSLKLATFSSHFLPPVGPDPGGRRISISQFLGFCSPLVVSVLAAAHASPVFGGCVSHRAPVLGRHFQLRSESGFLVSVSCAHRSIRTQAIFSVRESLSPARFLSPSSVHRLGLVSCSVFSPVAVQDLVTPKHSVYHFSPFRFSIFSLSLFSSIGTCAVCKLL
jgi:hypothetical protein